MKYFFVIVAAFFALISRGQQAFEFVSDGVKQQSAGVFDDEGKLIRSLFTGQVFPAGTTSYTWDGKDDFGKIVPQGKYSVRLLSHNMKAEWEGTIGNTSKQISNTKWGGSKRHNGYYGAAIDIYEHNNGWVYYTTGYSEGNVTLKKFHVDSTDVAVNLKANATTEYAERPGGPSLGLATCYNLCSDGDYLYASGLTYAAQTVVNGSFVMNNRIFIMKFDLKNDQMAPFSAGQTISPANYTYPGVIVLQQGLGFHASWPYMISGIAVDGNFLYATQKGQNKISVFNKTTGSFVSSTTGITNPRRMASEGAFIWVVFGANSVGKFAVSSNGTINPTPLFKLNNLSDPHAISLQTVGGIKYIYVTDGGNNQVIKRYRTSDGSLDNTFNSGKGYFGQLGGYTNNSIVTDDRFYFASNNDKLAGISVKPDGSFWLCDDGNNRMLRYNNLLTKTHSAEWQGATYHLQMVEGDNSRLLSGLMEFKVDYSSPLRSSWKLTNQYEPSTGIDLDPSLYFKSLVKLPNGRTYGLHRTGTGFNNGTIRGSTYFVLYELTSSGLRNTGIYKAGFGWSILPDGSLIDCSVRPGGSTVVTQYALNGFDNLQNPQWSNNGKVVGKIQTVGTDGVNGGLINRITEDGKLVFFDGAAPNNGQPPYSNYNQGYHIGAINYDPENGSTAQNWLWRNAYSTSLTYTGDYPSDGKFDIGNRTFFPGGQAQTTGDFITWNHHGEFWKQGQTNMHHLLYKNGLQLMQFGVAVANTQNILPKGYPGMAGNALTTALTKVGDVLYLWHGDESYHSGIHRWKISGLSTVKESVIPLYKTDKLESSFNFDHSFGCAPLAINFTDASGTGTEKIESWFWDFGDGSTSTERNPTHTFTTVGKYNVSLKITSANGDSSFFAALDTIRVASSPAISIVGDTIGCVFSKVYFKGKAEGDSTSNLTWEWEFGNGQKSASANPEPQVYSSEGYHPVSVKVTDSYGCNAQAESKFLALSAPKINISPEVEICQGDVAKLNASGAERFTWNNGSTLNCTDCASPSATPAQTTVYTVTGSNGSGCRAEAFVKVSVRQSHALSLAKTEEICEGQSVYLAADGVDQYSWSPATEVKDPTSGVTTATPKVSTLYTVVGRDKMGCFMDTASIFVTVRSLPKVNAGADLAICQGSAQQLQATGATWYQWTYAPTLSCTECSNPFAAPATNTQFVVTGIDEFGCSAADTVAVTVHQPFKLSVDQPADICIGQSARLAATGADQYSWTPVAGIAAPSAGVTTVTPQASTRYTVTAKDKYNCFTDTASVYVKVWPYPTVETGEAKTLQVGKSLELTPLYSSDVTRYQWTPTETLNCSNCPNPYASPINQTTYTITASNNGNCKASASVTVHVICNGGNLFIPNTFSPNGDGRNDRFYVKGIGLSKVKALKVYNRWGELVYSKENMPANNENVGWDGSYKGQQLPPDVYIYTCEVVCLNNEVLTYNGDVTLLR